MSFGSLCDESWVGNVNEANGWGIIYPLDADCSFLRVDTTRETVDDTTITVDKALY